MIIINVNSKIIFLPQFEKWIFIRFDRQLIIWRVMTNMLLRSIDSPSTLWRIIQDIRIPPPLPRSSSMNRWYGSSTDFPLYPSPYPSLSDFLPPRLFTQVYLVPSPLITRRWANPNTIINAVASVCTRSSLVHGQFPLLRNDAPRSLLFDVRAKEHRDSTPKTPSSLSLSPTTVLIPIACVP